jgi:MFS family permease
VSAVKILGLEAEKGRWLLVVCGMIINLALGAVYAYSILVVHFNKLFITVYGLKPTATELQLPFITALFLFAFTMPLMGRYIERYGPRTIAIIGGIVAGLGWFCSSFATSPLALIFLYGVIAGVGIGIAYNCPIVTSGRWFPDRRGLAVGLTLLGFGFSAAITGPLIDFLSAALGFLNAVRVLGILFMLMTVICALPLRFPLPGWTPRGWQPPKPTTVGVSVVAVDFMRHEMVKTRTFYGLWLCYTIGTLAGLMAIGIAKLVGFEVARNAGISEAEVSALLTALVVPFAACNGFGRPLFGWITDRIGPMKTAILSFILISIASIIIYAYPASLAIYALTFAILWLNLGGWLAIAPAATARFYGMKDYARNYGLVFTAYGTGAIIGNILAGQAKDIFGRYIAVFPYVLTLAIIGMIIAALTFKPPVKK